MGAEIGVLAMHASADTGTKQAMLRVFKGAELVHTQVLKLGKSYVLGRHRTVPIRLKSSRVSRRHASFELTKAGLRVTDLRSSNRVLIQGTAIVPGVPVDLDPKKTITICEYSLRFNLIGFGDTSGDGTREFAAKLAEHAYDLEIMWQLGRGADGSVWAAIDTARGRQVAVKLLHNSIAQTTENLERFFQEAEVCKRINSPYVVRVYDIRMVDQQPFITMEHVDGPTALERLFYYRAPLEFREVVSIGMDVANALVATANVGVVHRDVKPSNILLGSENAKLSDFGIAKALDRPSITEVGIGLGTLAYVAPEQALSAIDVDPRADIYGLGATLYHLLTGVPPYDATRPVLQLLEEITGGGAPIPILELRPDVPQALVDLLEHMLQKDPANRPQSATAVVAELKRINDFVLEPDSDMSQTHAD